MAASLNMKIVAALAAVLLLAGCSSTTKSGVYVPPTASGTNAPTLPSETPTSDAANEQAPQGFGTAYAYEDGLTVAAARPTAFTPSEYALSDKFPSYVAFVITIVNKTGKTFDPSMFNAVLQSGDVEGSEVFDTANGFEGAPSTKLLPNRQARFKIGFGATTKTDLVLDVRPGFDYTDAIFTS